MPSRAAAPTAPLWSANLLNVGGTLYGTTADGGIDACGDFSDQACGTVFSVNATTGAEQVVYFFKGGADGNFPTGGLINVGGTLYGTASQGGANGEGAVFSVNPGTGTEQICAIVPEWQRRQRSRFQPDRYWGHAVWRGQ